MKYTWTEAVREQALATLKEWIAIPSVLDEEASETPFGDNIQRCLETALKTCQQLGFSTYLDPQGYYGYAEVGQGEESLAILCHLDVVPAGDESKWTFPPFEATIHDGKMYGRGVQDDKGPSVFALYAVKALMDAGVTFNKRIRFIFGTDEETLWRCLNRYNEVEEKATYGFAPDSDFPLTYAEKGLLQAYLIGPGSQDLFVNNNGAFNVVPDKAVYDGSLKSQVLENLKLNQVAIDPVVSEICVLGKSVHSKDAAKGDNALSKLAKAFEGVSNHESVRLLNDHFVNNAYAESIFGHVGDEMSGRLSVNLAKWIVNEHESKIGLDLRIPVTADKDQLVEQLSKVVKEYGFDYQEFDYLRSLYVPVESELVQTLLSVYRDLTGDMTEPISSGGATFARTMDNCVAFGANLPGMKMLAHHIDEHTPLEFMYQAMEIYAHAVLKLATNQSV